MIEMSISIIFETVPMSDPAYCSWKDDFITDTGLASALPFFPAEGHQKEKTKTVVWF